MSKLVNLVSRFKIPFIWSWLFISSPFSYFPIILCISKIIPHISGDRSSIIKNAFFIQIGYPFGLIGMGCLLFGVGHKKNLAIIISICLVLIGACPPIFLGIVQLLSIVIQFTKIHLSTASYLVWIPYSFLNYLCGKFLIELWIFNKASQKR